MIIQIIAAKNNYELGWAEMWKPDDTAPYIYFSTFPVCDAGCL
jgi:hypothetical protein